MVKKKDGFFHMCVDYRRVNAATEFDCFSLLCLDQALDAVAGCSVFTSLDLAMAYYQLPFPPSDVEKTTFFTHAGLIEMTKMLFGLCNAASIYQRLISIVLRELITRICLAYLDDVSQLATPFPTLMRPQCSLRASLRCWLKTQAFQVPAFQRRNTVFWTSSILPTFRMIRLNFACCPLGRFPR